ncbi:sugar-binding domain-containing protein [Marinoscillum furvescens]|uniref:beta-galactosidase n=1 Tax=Marinoscillum furvescens DSM 4134 TaxID=1122208 RepID=A0A3D9L968_MARFU|nr:sugar-binding domain-containing protein [Marinoscillum furvescens]REE02216.1 glycosyl hydrolase family 2 [Marinoscillum furvescens DSM 4134]
MNKHLHIALLIFACLVYGLSFGQSHDLSGTWNVRLDSLDRGEQEQWQAARFESHSIALPGSLPMSGYGNEVGIATQWTGEILDSSWYFAPKYAKYRTPENIKIPFWLQPKKHYVGAAWYQREITLTSAGDYRLFLERPHWQTKVWIDNRAVGAQNSLATPHEFILKDLEKGAHVITIKVDNRQDSVDVGNSAHSLTDNTQTNWNGIVGSMELTALPAEHLTYATVRPDVKNGAVRVLLAANTGNAAVNVIVSDPTGQTVVNQRLQADSSWQSIDLPKPIQLWDEFSRNLYTLTVTVPRSEVSKTMRFGMRSITRQGRQFTLNGQPIFLRGTLDCAIFPKTGYPPTDKKEWKRIFQTVQDYGLNHVRYHSWCPPEAAFAAADEMGVYLQVEASSWANTPTSTVGDGAPIDAYIYQETKDILDTYGHHPSLCLVAYGNEPGGKNQKAYLADYIDHFRSYDPDKLYTSGAGWPFVPNADFYNHAGPRIQHWGAGLKSPINSQPPKSTDDYDELIESIAMPYVSHEMGQWCAYPDFNEIPLYDGVLQAKNYEIFQEDLKAKGLGHLGDDYLKASGALQVLGYKADMEKAFRTREMAGFQLLGLQDFSGQGTATVGVVNAFWEPKPYVSAAAFRSFCDTTVLLARFPRFTFSNADTFDVALELAHFGSQPIEGVVTWQVASQDKVLATGSIALEPFNRKLAVPVGSAQMELAQITSPQQLTLTATIGQKTNEWNFWVYPALETEQKIYTTNVLDKQVEKRLRKGGKVLYCIPSNMLRAEAGGNVGVGFSSIFWNTAYTSGQKPHTLGVLAQPDHAALNLFPTRPHSDWQWWGPMTGASAINLDALQADIQPIVRIIDDWFENRDLALLFEVKVGKGSLLVSGADLIKSEELSSKQLLRSLQQYMSSEAFQPKAEVTLDQIRDLTKSEADE